MRFSIKATTTIVSTLVLSSSFVAIVVMALNINAIKQALDEEFDISVSSLSKKLEAPILFEDTSYIEEIIEPLAENDSVSGACVFTAQGSLLANVSKEGFTCPSLIDTAGPNTSGFYKKAIYVSGEMIGVLYVSTNSTRLNAIKENIFFTTIIAVLAALIGLVVPVSIWLIKKYSKPVQNLINSTQELAIIDYPKRVEMPEDVMAVLYGMRDHMRETTELNKLLALRLSVFLRSRDMVLSGMQNELDLNHKFHEMNMRLHEKSGYDSGLAQELFALSDTEAHKLKKHFKRLCSLLDSQERFIDVAPHIACPKEVFTESFKRFYQHFQSDHVHYEIVDESSNQQLRFNTKAFEAFLQFSFIFAEKVSGDAKVLMRFHIRNNYKNSLLCSLEIFPMDHEGDFITPELLSALDEHTHKTLHIDEDLVSTVEKMKFYASYNTSQPEVISLGWDESLKLNFYIEEMDPEDENGNQYRPIGRK